MEIESLSRSQSSLSLHRAPSLFPSVFLCLSTFFSSTYKLCLSLLLVVLALEAVRRFHDDHCATLSSTSTFTPPSSPPTASSTYTHSNLQHSASTYVPFPFHCRRIQRHRPRPPLKHPTTDPATPPCVPHLSNDLLLMLYQLTLQTSSLSLPHPLEISLTLPLCVFPFLFLALLRRCACKATSRCMRASVREVLPVCAPGKGCSF